MLKLVISLYVAVTCRPVPVVLPVVATLVVTGNNVISPIFETFIVFTGPVIVTVPAAPAPPPPVKPIVG